MITLTETAANQIKSIMEEHKMESDKTYVRIGILGQSCSGLNYNFGFDDELTDSDEIFEQSGLKVIHDKKYSDYLKEVVVDFKEINDQKGFTFENSTVIESCSTGGGGCCGGGGCGR